MWLNLINELKNNIEGKINKIYQAYQNDEWKKEVGDAKMCEEASVTMEKERRK